MSERELTAADPGALEWPFPLFEQLRVDGTSVLELPGLGLMVFGQEAVVEVSKQMERFSTNITGGRGAHLLGLSPEPYSPEVTELVAQYRPMATDVLMLSGNKRSHDREKALVLKAMSPRHARELGPTLQDICNELVDAFIDAGRCEWVSQFAAPLPITIIADTLGVDRADWETFKGWSDALFKGFQDQIDNPERVKVAGKILEFQAYMTERIEARRENPREDLLSDLVHVEVEAHELEDADFEGKRRLTEAELLGIVVQIVTAGNHTTAALLGTAMVALAERPELAAELQKDFSLIPDFIEEVLRFDAPVPQTWRVTTEDAELGGCPVAAGTIVVPVWSAANLDPEQFPDPHTFDIRRPNGRRHLSFGRGPHSCPGAGLAREEARIAFETVLTRLGNLRLAPGHTLEHAPSMMVRAYKEIPLEFDRRA
ncbi:cytochrome P450 [Sporichthya sp.]|uniref:cytochrome P450 n=1 Tax=Sporichthya sp. TaxID=65475 RepID=UPI0017E5A031|nr:cytochrome P450 [Sporichthya sp.]MBA3741760.1 cytochrome P450 [Sporichthya sp.]